MASEFPPQTSLGGRVLRNTAFLTGGQIVVTGLNLLLIAILANALGVEEFGRYGLAMSVASLVLVIVDFGSRQLVVRQVSRVDASASKYCVNGLVVKAVLTVFAVGGAVLFATHTYGTGNGEAGVAAAEASRRAIGMTGLVLCACIAFSCSATTDSLLAFFYSREKMHVAAAVQSGQVTAYAVGAIVLVLLFGWRAQGVLAWQMGCFAAVTCVVYLMVSQSFRIRWHDVSAGFIRKYLGELWVFAVLYIASQGIVHFPPIVLSFQVGEAQLGVYQAAARAVLAIDLLPRLFNFGVFPVLMKTDSVEPEKWSRLAEASLRYSMLAGLWFASALALIAEEVSAFVFRAEGFGAVGGVLRLMCLLVFFRFITYPLGTLLVALNRERWCATVTPLAALLAAGVTWATASRFGAWGAGMAWVVGGLFVSLGYGLGMWRVQRHLMLSPAMVRALLASGIVLVLVVLGSQLSFPWRIGYAILLAPVVGFCCRAFAWKDVVAMRNAFLDGIRLRRAGTARPGEADDAKE